MPSAKTYIIMAVGMALVAITIGAAILIRSLSAYWEPTVWISSVILAITAVLSGRNELKNLKGHA